MHSPSSVTLATVGPQRPPLWPSVQLSLAVLDLFIFSSISSSILSVFIRLDASLLPAAFVRPSVRPHIASNAAPRSGAHSARSPVKSGCREPRRSLPPVRLRRGAASVAASIAVRVRSGISFRFASSLCFNFDRNIVTKRFRPTNKLFSEERQRRRPVSQRQCTRTEHRILIIARALELRVSRNQK